MRAPYLVTAVDAKGLHHQLVAHSNGLLPSTLRTCVLSTYGRDVSDDEAADVEVFVTSMLWELRLNSTAERYDQAREVVISVAQLDTFPAGVPHGDDDALLAIVARRLLTDEQTEVEILTPRGGTRSITLTYASTILTSGERQAVTRAMTRQVPALPIATRED